MAYIKPASGAITSGFGPRKAPIPGASTYHNGIDFGIQWNNSNSFRVVATAAGTVSVVTTNSVRGRYIDIYHGGGITTRYQHLAATYVKKGQKVSKGQLIGKIGSTGLATGPHLHFEVLKNGKPVNPMPYFSLKPGVDYLARGMKGANVKKLQQKLNSKGYKPKLAEDSSFGPLVEKAVRWYQTKNKLQVDGKAGPQTLKHLGLSFG